MNHYRTTIKKYRARRQVLSCPFCDDATRSKAIYEDKHIYIVPNLTKYDLWEGHEVEDHLLIVPKRHIKKLLESTDAERKAIINQMAEYEAKGYSGYARGYSFVKRSVEHQHTHLIKVSNKLPRVILFIKSPYYLWRR